MPAPGGEVSASGPKGVSASGPGGCLPLVRWGYLSQHAVGQTSPPVNRMTDRCKNITFTNFVCGQY